MDPKRLLLLRHAKSSWDDPEMPDHDRPLSARGRSVATRVGRHLREVAVHPDLVLCSSAARTRETQELLGLDADVSVLSEDRLYGASAPTLLARLRKVRGGVETVLVIGHNPGIEELTALLVDGAPANAATFPTAGLADLRLPIRSWDEIEPGIAVLHAFVVPRDLA